VFLFVFVFVLVVVSEEDLVVVSEEDAVVVSEEDVVAVAVVFDDFSLGILGGIKSLFSFDCSIFSMVVAMVIFAE